MRGTVLLMALLAASLVLQPMPAASEGSEGAPILLTDPNQPPEGYYYRPSDGHEVFLVEDSAWTLARFPVEETGAPLDPARPEMVPQVASAWDGGDATHSTVFFPQPCRDGQTSQVCGQHAGPCNWAKTWWRAPDDPEAFVYGECAVVRLEVDGDQTTVTYRAGVDEAVCTDDPWAATTALRSAPWRLQEHGTASLEEPCGPAPPITGLWSHRLVVHWTDAEGVLPDQPGQPTVLYDQPDPCQVHPTPADPGPLVAHRFAHCIWSASAPTLVLDHLSSSLERDGEPAEVTGLEVTASLQLDGEARQAAHLSCHGCLDPVTPTTG